MDTPDAPRTLEYRDIDELRPALTNPKAHADAELAAAVERFGYTEPPMLDERTGRLVVGHGRLESLQARRKAGKEPPDGIVRAEDGRWLMPVVRGWHSKSDAEARAYIITSNRLTELGGWKQDQLYDDLASVKLDTGDLAGIGFTDRDLEALRIKVKPYERTRPNPDDAPLPLPVVTSRPGDVWLCGAHRVLCGDAASPEDHQAALQGETADLVLTDPPYGVGVDYGAATDDTPEAIGALVDAFMPLALEHRRVMVTPGHTMLWRYPRPTWLLAWVHPAGMGNGPWGFTMLHPVLVYGTDPYLQAGLGGRPDTLVLAADREDELAQHPVVKPAKVWRWLLERGTTQGGQLVLDPFLGSGTTLVVAEETGRRCVGIEVEPRFVDVAVRRWQNYSGQTAVLEATGEAFDAVQRAEAAPVAG